MELLGKKLLLIILISHLGLGGFNYSLQFVIDPYEKGPRFKGINVTSDNNYYREFKRPNLIRLH